MSLLKLVGAAILGLIGGGFVGFALLNVVGAGLLLAGEGGPPSWAALLKYLVAVGAALGLVSAPMLVARRAVA